ncbi:hypothetical protein Bca101_046455 [Brassica carinata]
MFIVVPLLLFNLLHLLAHLDNPEDVFCNTHVKTQRHAMSFVNLKDTNKEDIVNIILAQNTTIVAAT